MGQNGSHSQVVATAYGETALFCCLNVLRYCRSFLAACSLPQHYATFLRQQEKDVCCAAAKMAPTSCHHHAAHEQTTLFCCLNMVCTVLKFSTAFRSFLQCCIKLLRLQNGVVSWLPLFPHACGREQNSYLYSLSEVFKRRCRLCEQTRIGHFIPQLPSMIPEAAAMFPEAKLHSCSCEYDHHFQNCAI